MSTSTRTRFATVCLISFFAGCLVHRLLALNVLPFWLDLDLLIPVSSWLVSNGFVGLAGTWGVVWILVPFWTAIFCVGLISRWLVGDALAVVGLAFFAGMFGQVIIAQLHMRHGMYVWSSFEPKLMLWDLTLVPMYFSGASLLSIRHCRLTWSWRCSIAHVLLVTAACAVSLAIVMYDRSIGVPLVVLAGLSAFAYVGRRTSIQSVYKPVPSDRELTNQQR